MQRYTVLFWQRGFSHLVQNACVVDHAYAANAIAAIRDVQEFRSVHSAEIACAIPPDTCFPSDCTWITLSSGKVVR